MLLANRGASLGGQGRPRVSLLAVSHSRTRTFGYCLNSVLRARICVWYGDGGCLGLTKPLRDMNSCISIVECEV